MTTDPSKDPLPVYAPHASPALTRPAAAGRTAGLTAPALAALPAWLVYHLAHRNAPVDGDVYGADPSAVEPPAPGLEVPSAAPEPVTWVAAVAALTALYVSYRLLVTRRVPAATGDPRPCRCLTWFGVGTGLAGLTALLPAVGGWLGAPSFALAVAVLAGGLATGSALVPALLCLPGAASGMRVRLRRALDGAIVGLCLLFCGWVLVIAPHRSVNAIALLVVMFHCCVLSIAVIAGARHARWRGPLLCAAGVCVAMVALPGLAFALAHGAGAGWLAIVGALLVAGPLLVWQGAGELTSSYPATGPRGSVITVPAALAVTVALYQLVSGGTVDRTELMLATLAALTVGVRQLIVGRGARVAGGSAVATPGPAQPRRVVPRPRSGTHPLGDRSMYNDASTGLPNRLHVSLSIAGMRCVARSPGALLIIRLNGVDAAADAARADVLLEVARRLRRVAASEERGAGPTGSDLPARWSATEFAVLTPANLAQAYGLADRLTTVLAAPVPLAGEVVRLSASVGLTDLAGATSTEDVIRRADVAVRRASQLGPGRVEWYDASVQEAVTRREVVERELPEALRQGELDLIYQPIMDLERGRPLAVEALLRWRHPRLGTLLPADVIPVAEETGFIADVDHWVLQRASAQLAAWRQEGRNLSMAVNVSARDLHRDEFTAEVASVLATTELPPDRLVLEVAEAGLADTGLEERMGALRSVGVRTALDEFGAGVSSFAHLRRLPIDMVKIGQSFFATVAADGAPRPDCRRAGVGDTAPLIDAMVGVGRRLGIDVVAQGVEAPAQLAVVRTAGCKIGQGHLFARPQPAEHTEAYLDGFVRGTEVTARGR